MKYITTPIYYVNDIPHIGHAYTTIAADVMSRYWKARGDDVFFLTGIDEHGAKIAEAAKEAGKEPKEFVDELAPKFQNAWKKLNIGYSQFFRTTNLKHEGLVQEFVKGLQENGCVEKRQYEGLYCVACEQYYKEVELIEGKCPVHKTEPVKQSEENYFFLLSKFSDQLKEKIEKGVLVIGPESRKNEVLGKIKQGLEDVSISRAFVNWGIPFPGDDSQTIYVWVDALLNYYTATKIYETTKWEDHPADLHLMAKDILWFHAIIWPAMLIALDKPLPKKIFAHGFFTIGGHKMSKTIGNVIDPNAVVDKYGADALRYALLREFPFGEDGDISDAKIAERYNKELANELGNLLQRTLSMINRYQVKIRNPTRLVRLDSARLAEGKPRRKSEIRKDISDKVGELIEDLKFNEALQEIWKIVLRANRYIDESKPWELANNDSEKLNEVLGKTYGDLALAADLLTPFIPETAEKISCQLETLKPEPLFPRIDRLESSSQI